MAVHGCQTTTAGDIMKGLLIKNRVSWRDCWSAEIGKKLRVMDSTYDLLIFDESHDTTDILAIIGEAPTSCYQILELEAASQDLCDFVADSGKCYRRLN
jgi:hypothetical protein